MIRWRVIVVMGLFLGAEYVALKKSRLGNMGGMSNKKDDGAMIHAEVTGGNASLGRGLRIAFQSVDEVDYELPDWYSSIYSCPATSALPPSLVSDNSNGRRILDFSTIVSTDLKIIFVGDSVSGQFSEMFDAAATRNADPRSSHILLKRKALTCLTVASPVTGGGVTAFWRIHGTLSRQFNTSSVLCSDERRLGIWGRLQLSQILFHSYPSPRNESLLLAFNFNHTANTHSTHSIDNPPMQQQQEAEHQLAVNAFDAVILRLPYGWMNLDDFTKEAITEAIISSNEILGAETVIISTLPFDNNVQSYSHWEKIANINQMLRDIAIHWKPPPNRRNAVRWVLIQEFGNFTNQILWSNALHMGYNLSTPDFTRLGWEQHEAHFLLERLNERHGFPRSIPALCSNIPPNKLLSECNRSRITIDGKHWCPDTLGPRFAASMACLLGCVYNKILRESDQIKVRRCEQACNDRFMSLEPLSEEWLKPGNILYSRIPSG